MSILIRDGRRLSPLRAALALLLVGALAAGGFLAHQTWSSERAVASTKPWFAGYVDVTATPAFAFEQPQTDAGRDVVLSFIVSDGECRPTWGGYFSMDEAAAKLDLDRRIARLKQQEGEIAISFGGLNNDELATTCSDENALARAYSDVLARYGVTTIDFDVEADDLADTAAGERRAKVIAELQRERRDSDGDLAVWLTLPAATFGLTEEGTTAVAQMLDAGVDLAGVNIMTMNFGDSREKRETMGEAAVRSLQATHRQLTALYQLADQELSAQTLWRKLGATPMIGQNDIPTEALSLDDATELNEFATGQGIGRMSMWSLNRDAECGPNYVDVTRVSDACSGVPQDGESFADTLANGFDGRLALAAGHVTKQEPRDPADFVDDPETSPYPIWSEDASYLKGTKIVWHRNVYEAKWWTSGELPDSPVLNEWETPWTLIGPVLENERPVPVPTLPPGTYPDWDGLDTYDKGDRVLFEGSPYQAKWWNQGESPEASHSDPDGSPWTALDIEDVQEELEAATDAAG
ncbi:chitinase [Lysobacter korlensis]|uniref:Chitinase n=1 Tax=Lysobacter korlensis TaxID=553636 RepID=A0ABV6RVK8_9GAMM